MIKFNFKQIWGNTLALYKALQISFINFQFDINGLIRDFIWNHSNERDDIFCQLRFFICLFNINIFSIYIEKYRNVKLIGSKFDIYMVILNFKLSINITPEDYSEFQEK
ncbi:MAG: hypothetical protein PHP92_03625 [Candidatus Nanoarchaeia archaeon]|nr:hypothetical protein [Candidatus Nanoarchaeia archaeon]